MSGDDNVVDQMVGLAVEAFHVAARSRRFSPGDSLTVPVALPENAADAPIDDVLSRLGKLGYWAAHTSGANSFTVSRTNMPGTPALDDREVVSSVIALMGQMVALQSSLQKTPGLSKAEIISLISLFWAILYGVLTIVTK